MNHLPDNFFVCLDLFLDWETYEQARRYIRSVSNFNRQDATYSLFLATIDLLEGSLQEALRSFSELLEHRTLSLAATTGQLCVYERQAIPDGRSTEKLHALLSQAKNQAEPDGLFLGGWMLFRQGKYREAADSLHGVLQRHADHGQALTLLAIVEMRSAGLANKAKTHLDSAIKLTGDHLCQARLALVNWHILQKDVEQAQLELREVCRTWEKVIPVRVANVTMQMILRNWDGVGDAADWLLSLDSQLLIGHFFITLLPIYSVLPAKGKDLDATLQLLLGKIQKAEPKNPALWGKFTRICSRASGDVKTSEKCLTMLQQITTTFPNSGVCLLEAGDELMLLDRPEEARGYYQRAMKIPSHARLAMIGEAKALVRLNSLTQAERQCDHVDELSKLDTSDTSAWLPYSEELAFLRIVVAMSQENTVEATGKTKSVTGGANLELSQKLSTLLFHHLQHLKSQTFDLDFVLRIDPPFVASLVQEALQRCPSQPSKVVPEKSLLQQCEHLLGFIRFTTPGLTDLSVLLARVHFLEGDSNAALRILESSIQSERFGRNSSAFTTAAEIYLKQGQRQKARTSLDRALANSFNLKTNLRFLCLEARYNGIGSGSIGILTTLVDRARKASSTDTVQDRCSVFLDLADAYFVNKDTKKSLETLGEAEELFQGTSQAARVNLARVDYLIAANSKSKVVVDLLESVEPEDVDFYFLAQEKLASYYLKNGMQKDYTLLYEKLFQQMQETPAASVMLGNAYLKVPMARKAIDVIQTALKRQPGNVTLESAMGNVLTKCHMFANALNYYEAAIKKGNRTIRKDYINLLNKLKRYERAEDLLLSFIAEDGTNVDDQMQTANFLKILADTQNTLGKPDARLNTLTKAKDFCEKLNLRVRRENPDVISALHRILIDVLNDLSDISSVSGDYPAALQFSRQAQTFLDGDDRSSVLLQQALIHLRQSDTSEAFRLIKEIQKTNPQNKEALRLAGDIALRRKDFDMATTYYKEYLKTYPDDYVSISQIIPLLTRIGQLHVVKAYFDEQGSRSDKRDNVAFEFCAGLYSRQTGDIQTAITKIMPATKVPEFSSTAVRTLVEMMCNWDTELISSVNLPSSLKNLKIPDDCLKDLQLTSSDPLYGFVQALPILSCGGIKEVTALLAELEPLEPLPVITPEKGYLLATTFLLLGAKERAITVLRRFDKSVWNIQDADFLERIWLLLADQLDINNRGDEVSQLIFRTMEFSKTGYLVNMLEGLHCSTQNFPKAAECYRRAFEATGCRDFVSGERYAWAQLNANRPMEAIEALDSLERKSLALFTGDRMGETSGKAAAVRAMRSQALLQLALRTDERNGKADAAGRRQSRA